jgi:hypothetical protein
MNFQNSRDASQHRDGWIAFAALDAPEMSHRDLGGFRQLSLCQVLVLSDPTNVHPDDFFPIRHARCQLSRPVSTRPRRNEESPDSQI